MASQAQGGKVKAQEVLVMKSGDVFFQTEQVPVPSADTVKNAVSIEKSVIEDRDRRALGWDIFAIDVHEGVIDRLWKLFSGLIA